MVINNLIRLAIIVQLICSPVIAVKKVSQDEDDIVGCDPSRFVLTQYQDAGCSVKTDKQDPVLPKEDNVIPYQKCVRSFDDKSYLMIACDLESIDKSLKQLSVQKFTDEKCEFKDGQPYLIKPHKCSASPWHGSTYVKLTFRPMTLIQQIIVATIVTAMVVTCLCCLLYGNWYRSGVSSKNYSEQIDDYDTNRKSNKFNISDNPLPLSNRSNTDKKV